MTFEIPEIFGILKNYTSYRRQPGGTLIGFLGHLSNSGDLLLWVGVRRPSSVVRRASCVNILSKTTGTNLTKFGM